MPQVNKSESCGAVVVGNELHVFFSVVSRVDGICVAYPEIPRVRPSTTVCLYKDLCFIV
jgi:hypothetical protein